MKKIMISESGYTLIEILGVVAVIAILATVSVTSIVGAIQGGRESALKRQVQTLNSAYQEYKSAGGFIPNGTAPQDAINTLCNQVNLAGTSQQVGPFLTSSNPATHLHAKGGANNEPLTWSFTEADGFTYLTGDPTPESTATPTPESTATPTPEPTAEPTPTPSQGTTVENNGPFTIIVASVRDVDGNAAIYGILAPGESAQIGEQQFAIYVDDGEGHPSSGISPLFDSTSPFVHLVFDESSGEWSGVTASSSVF